MTEGAGEFRGVGGGNRRERNLRDGVWPPERQHPSLPRLEEQVALVVGPAMPELVDRELQVAPAQRQRSLRQDSKYSAHRRTVPSCYPIFRSARPSLALAANNSAA